MGGDAYAENEKTLEEFAPQAREVLQEILEKYIEYGTAQFQIPEILKVPPISHRGTVVEIAVLFGGAPKLMGEAGSSQRACEKDAVRLPAKWIRFTRASLHHPEVHSRLSDTSWRYA